MKSSAIHIVLIEPEIPQNAGNIGRTCVGLGATLHLVGRLGFSLADKDLKRAGLDYWPKLDFKCHASWEDFMAQVVPGAELNFFSTHGKKSLWNKKFQTPAYLIFGSESHGFPPSFYDQFKDQLIRIPVSPSIRSLNLATTVGVVAFETARQISKRSV